MTIIMCSIRVLSIVSLFVADVWTGTMQYSDSPRRCHHCAYNTTNKCARLSRTPVLCPVGQPFCATIAKTPNFTSSLSCAAAKETPCLLTLNPKLELEMSCTCSEHLCNVPYSTQLRNELLNFSTKIPANATELTETFLKSSVFANVTKMEMYKMITEVSDETEKLTAASSETATNALVGLSDIGPRAEALKHEATLPPDDDEDEGEGSGTFEGARTQAAPAAPSSYLPAEENKVAAKVLNFYLLLSSLYSFIYSYMLT